jgi:hypothetical protein
VLSQRRAGGVHGLSSVSESNDARALRLVQISVAVSTASGAGKLAASAVLTELRLGRIVPS